MSSLKLICPYEETKESLEENHQGSIPKIKISILPTVWHTSFKDSYENLVVHQDNIPQWVMIFFVLNDCSTNTVITRINAVALINFFTPQMRRLFKIGRDKEIFSFY